MNEVPSKIEPQSDFTFAEIVLGIGMIAIITIMFMSFYTSANDALVNQNIVKAVITSLNSSEHTDLNQEIHGIRLRSTAPSDKVVVTIHDVDEDACVQLASMLRKERLEVGFVGSNLNSLSVCTTGNSHSIEVSAFEKSMPKKALSQTFATASTDTF